MFEVRRQAECVATAPLLLIRRIVQKGFYLTSEKPHLVYSRNMKYPVKVRRRLATLHNTQNPSIYIRTFDFFRMFDFFWCRSQQYGLKGSLAKLLNNCCVTVNKARSVFVHGFCPILCKTYSRYHFTAPY